MPILARLLIAFLTLVVVGCRPASSLPVVDLRFVSAGGTETPKFKMEVVASPEARSKGLMFRRQLDEQGGMLFVFPEQDVHSFWMKNTVLSLDMVFVSADWRVVGILKRVPPMNEEPRRVEQPSQYVLEFQAGTADRIGLVEGATVKVDGVLPRGY
jgi:uncharacterized membrane protein (UPF0127 family)